MALREAYWILNLRVTESHPDFLKIATLKRETLAAVLSTQAKVDETMLRGAKTDRRRELVQKIKDESGIT